jgi:hypothetical protein
MGKQRRIRREEGPLPCPAPDSIERVASGAVQLKSTRSGREREVPFVLRMQLPGEHRLTDISYADRPPYAEVRARAPALIARQLAQSGRA